MQSVDFKNKLSYCKANELIENSKQEKNTYAGKCLRYISSHLTKEDVFFPVMVFDVREFCVICNLDPECRENRRFIRATILELSDASKGGLMLKSPTGWSTPIPWLKYAFCKNDGSHQIAVVLNSALEKYYLGLQKRFTQVDLATTLNLEKPNSVPIYEIMKMHAYRHSGVVAIEDLKERLNLEGKYARFSNFKSRVLDSAIDEINEKTDLKVSYQVKCNKRVPTDLVFSIQKSNNVIDNSALNRLMKYKLSEKDVEKAKAEIAEIIRGPEGCTIEPMDGKEWGSEIN